MISAVPDKPKISHAKCEHGQITIHWNYDHDGGKPVKSITIEYQKNIDNTWNKIQVSIPLKQYTIPTLQPETLYIFKVAIRNEIGESEFSDPYEAKTLEKGIFLLCSCFSFCLCLFLLVCFLLLFLCV